VVFNHLGTAVARPEIETVENRAIRGISTSSIRTRFEHRSRRLKTAYIADIVRLTRAGPPNCRAVGPAFLLSMLFVL
jgi:hypothetical protein